MGSIQKMLVWLRIISRTPRQISESESNLKDDMTSQNKNTAVDPSTPQNNSLATGLGHRAPARLRGNARLCPHDNPSEPRRRPCSCSWVSRCPQSQLYDVAQSTRMPSQRSYTAFALVLVSLAFVCCLRPSGRTNGCLSSVSVLAHSGHLRPLMKDDVTEGCKKDAL